MLMSFTESQLWQEIITSEWHLDFVREKLRDPTTVYPGRPLLLSNSEVMAARLFDLSDAHLSVRVAGYDLAIKSAQILSVVESTFAKLLENLTDSDGIIGQYLAQEWATYQSLNDKRAYGFYAFYFDRAAQFEAAVQFPSLPVYKLALTCSASQLYQDKDYLHSWLENRFIFNRAHVLVAGASVASVTAETLIRDGRLGYVTIGDPKPPNVTNFNRTAYDVFDIASDDNSKAISFARRMHRQDPTQIIYLEPRGLKAENFLADLCAPARPAVDLVVEALDDINLKLEIINLCGQVGVPLVAVSDVGSKAQLTFRDSWARQRGDSLVFGLNDRKLQQLLEHDFLQAAAYIVGLENALGDEIGRYLKGLKNTPFGASTPQLGSTAQVAAGQAAEEILRFLLNRDQNPFFAAKRLTIDKKNHRLWIRQKPSLKEKILGSVLAISRKCQPKRR